MRKSDFYRPTAPPPYGFKVEWPYYVFNYSSENIFSEIKSRYPQSVVNIPILPLKIGRSNGSKICLFKDKCISRDEIHTLRISWPYYCGIIVLHFFGENKKYELG